MSSSAFAGSLINQRGALLDLRHAGADLGLDFLGGFGRAVGQPAMTPRWPPPQTPGPA